MKVKLLALGGTLLMYNTEAGLAPAGSMENLLHDLPTLKHLADYTLLTLANLDSADLNPEHWREVTNQVLYAQGDGYDAVVVVQGTDTLAYTATAVALLLGNLNTLGVPVVLTGVQMPFDKPGSDARTNLERAVMVAVTAAQQKLADVMVVFGDRVLRGCRTLKVSERAFHAFDTPGYPHLGRIDAFGVTLEPTIRRRPVPFRAETPDNGIWLAAKLSNEVMAINLMPGFQRELVLPLVEAGTCKGLLLNGFGIGTYPTKAFELSVVPLIQTAVRKQVPVLLGSQVQGAWVDPTVYEAGKLALDAGGIACRDMTPVAAIIKLMMAVGTNRTSGAFVKDFFATSLAGEVTPAK